MVAGHIHWATGIFFVIATLLVVFQLLTLQEAKPILFPFPGQPGQALFFGAEDAALAVTAGFGWDFFGGGRQQVKAADLTRFHLREPVGQIPLSSEVHPRQKACLIDRAV